MKGGPAHTGCAMPIRQIAAASIRGIIGRLFITKAELVSRSSTSCVLHQRHKTEIHVQLHVAVVEREAGIIGDKINFSALAAG